MSKHTATKKQTEAPRFTNVVNRVHTQAALVMLYWWELKHLYLALITK